MHSSVLACCFSQQKDFLPKFINNNPFLKIIKCHYAYYAYSRNHTRNLETVMNTRLQTTEIWEAIHISLKCAYRQAPYFSNLQYVCIIRHSILSQYSVHTGKAELFTHKYVQQDCETQLWDNPKQRINKDLVPFACTFSREVSSTSLPFRVCINSHAFVSVIS